MEARIVFGRVMHRRLRPVARDFSYRVFFLQIPLARLDRLGSRWLSVDRWNLFSLMRRDFGPRDGSDLEPWIRGVLARHGVGDCEGEIVLQAFPRILGYVFNPIALWYCHDRAGALRAVLCEVSNTFGERHNYLLFPPGGRAIARGESLTAPKRFHVSPFCAVEGHYRFRFRGDAPHPATRIDYHDAGGLLLVTALHGSARSLSDALLARAFFSYPAMTLAVVARIHWQALRLWMKRVPWFPKPHPPLQETTVERH